MEEQSTLRTNKGNQATQRVEGEQSTQRIMEGQSTQRLSEELMAKGMGNTNVFSDGVGINGLFFSLDGKVYKAIKSLSKSSGEAQILLVERDGVNYVLKLYYPNFSPEDGLLQVIWNINFELIVKIYSFGKTIVDGASRDYELMEYLEGGSLIEYRLNKDEKQFQRIALSAAAALAYCHNCNIIHKDIKLGNFIFRDTESEYLVLSDFGISALTSDEGIAHTTQARTPLYAAPEMYEDVIDGVVELTPKADYYSLGIMLFFLWLERNPFSGNERSMMRMKSEGRLPNLDKLPEAVRHIIRGLTVVNPEKRWGYDEVERWYKGEKVEVDESSVYLKYKSFIVDSEKNILAENAQELAELLSVRRTLGIKYLYSKSISLWLEECGNHRLAIELNDIVDQRYPTNQEAGFQAALYTLDKKLPYSGPKGELCYNVHEIVYSMISNIEEYRLLLQNENHPLYIYLEMTTELEVSRLREYFKTDKPDIAIWRMIYEIDEEVPFLSDKPSSTIKEIIASFSEGSCSEDEWHSLTDGRLLSWLYYKCDPLLYLDIKELYDEKRPYTRSEAYDVLYHLDNSIGFDLRDATQREQVAALMSGKLTELQYCTNNEFIKGMDEYIGDKCRLVYYAKIRGWKDVLRLQSVTFNLRSTENINRYGMYDIWVASYRFCMSLGGTPEYYVRAGGHLLGSLKQFKQMDIKLVRPEMETGSLKQWLTVFYHENPFETYQKEYSYEYALRDYLQEVGRVNPDDYHYKRLKYACEQSKDKLKSFRFEYATIRVKEKTLYTLFLGSTACLCLLLLLLGYSNSHEFIKKIFFAVGLPVGTMSMVLAGTRSYFNGNGVSLTVLAAILGAASAMIPVRVLKYIGPEHPHMLALASIAMLVIYVGIALWTGGRGKKSMYKAQELKPILQENINTTLLDPLYYAYRQKSSMYKGSNYKALDDVIGVMNAMKVELYIHYVQWTVFMAVLLGMFICFHPKLLNIKDPDTENIKVKTIEFIEQLKSTESHELPTM